jgi:hypothetical protein
MTNRRQFTQLLAAVIPTGLAPLAQAQCVLLIKSSSAVELA